MKTKHLSLLIAMISIMITAVSCKKNSNNSSDNYNYLQGYWKGSSSYSSTSPSQGMAYLIMPDNKYRLYVNVDASSIEDTTSADVVHDDETWSVTNNTLKITGTTATSTANLTKDQSTLSGTILFSGGNPLRNFSLTKQ